MPAIYVKQNHNKLVNFINIVIIIKTFDIGMYNIDNNIFYAIEFFL